MFMVISDLITIILAVAGAAATVFLCLKDFVRDQLSHLKDQLHEQKIENVRAINQLRMENLRLSIKLERMERFLQILIRQLLTRF